MMATVRMASSWAPERRGIVFADSAARVDEVGTGEMLVLRANGLQRFVTYCTARAAELVSSASATTYGRARSLRRMFTCVFPWIAFAPPRRPSVVLSTAKDLHPLRSVGPRRR